MTSKKKQIIFYIFLFMFIFAFTTTALNYDLDLWTRITLGKYVVQMGHVPMRDFLSYAPTHKWIDHEWGSGVIFYLVQRFFSSFGLLVLQTILAFSLFFVISKIIELRGVKTTSAFNFLFYFFSFFAIYKVINIPVRCQMFTFLLFAVFLYILELSRKGQYRPLWALPVIMLMWNNLHGGCVSGIGLLLIYIVGEFLNKKPIKQYFIPFALSVLVLPINPWGFSYIIFLLKSVTMSRLDIREWHGLFSHFYIRVLTFFIFYSAVLLSAPLFLIEKNFFKKKPEIDYTKILVLAVTLYLAVSHVKLLPLALISMAAFLYDDFYTLFNKLTKNIFDKFAPIKESIVYLLVLIFFVSHLNSNIFKPALTWYKFPIVAIEFLKINHLEGNLLTDFDYGGYASYKLYPANKIFIDGRYEAAYFPFELPMLIAFNNANNGWDEILKKYPPNLILISKGFEQTCKNLILTNKKWKMIFQDQSFIILADVGYYKKYKKKRPSFIAPSSDLNDYKRTLFDTSINFKK